MADSIPNNEFSNQLFEYRNVEKKKLMLSFSITFIVMIVEIIGGYLTNSIALLSDAGHMFTHCFAIAIGLVAIIIAKKPPCHHRTFGLYRAEVLAAFINGLFLLVVAFIIIYEAYLRIVSPLEVLGFEMLGIAFIGLGTNIVSILILHGSQHGSLNIRGVFYHMIADAISSVGIIIAAVIIIYTKWDIIDPLVSIGISILIVYWSWGILKQSSRILLEVAPPGMDVDTISGKLQETFSEISSLHNVHLWTITPEMIMFSAHVTLKNKEESEPEQLIQQITKFLKENYHILEATIQITSEYPTCKID